MKHLELNDPRARIFRWAIQERNYMEKTVRDTAADNSHGGRGSLVQDKTLQPMASFLFNMSLSACPMNRTLATLTTLFTPSTRLWKCCVTLLSLDPSIIPCFGQGWIDLPVLTSLHMILDWAERLVIDPQLLAHCPNLTDLRLQDNSQEYSH